MKALYKVSWFLLMVLVLAPSFIFAAFVEDIGWAESRAVVLGMLTDFLHFPYALALPLSPVVAAVAKALPATSTSAVMGGEMVWEHFGVIMTFLFFALVQAPSLQFKRKAKAEEAHADAEIADLVKAH